jgi:hypothetical protein
MSDVTELAREGTLRFVKGAIRPTDVHDARSLYVERYWLPVLGPTSVMLSRLAYLELARLAEDESWPITISDLAKRLGLGDRSGVTSPGIRAVERLIGFSQAYVDDGYVRIRPNFPFLSTSGLRRLPWELAVEHEAMAPPSVRT